MKSFQYFDFAQYRLVIVNDTEACSALESDFMNKDKEIYGIDISKSVFEFFNLYNSKCSYTCLVLYTC